MSESVGVKCNAIRCFRVLSENELVECTIFLVKDKGRRRDSLPGRDLSLHSAGHPFARIPLFRDILSLSSMSLFIYSPSREAVALSTIINTHEPEDEVEKSEP